jgi:phosphohistidine phosphatase
MEIYILRHGIAADLGEGGVTRDADRPLTEEGCEKMQREAKGMRELGLKFDLIFTSPLLRTQQTAEAVAEVLNLKDKVIAIDALAPGRAFVRGVNKKSPIFVELGAHQFERALLVGHQPDMTEIASALLTGDRHLNVEFKKGALCAIEISGIPPLGPGLLRWLLTPRQLKLIARS